ncbi:superoxide dismutase [Cu-Zn] SodC [Gilvimarinus sp. F26214L]|uniref:superoxide dismutase [Cu-Zn] SodC n=1 Tax=Gilvimarinus sp. DZF01 TaxID=3461371 RepID=UPI00404618DB
MKKLLQRSALAGLAMLGAEVAAEEYVVTMHAVSDTGVEQAIGEITLKEVDDGLVFEPRLEGLKPGIHGFHVHENPDCGPQGPDGKTGPALAAGGHYDPENKGVHKAPWEEGHLGDLPALYVEDDQTATHPVYKDDLELSDVRGRALMIHEGGDNYADEPEPLGGGGGRVACGIIEKE